MSDLRGLLFRLWDAKVLRRDVETCFVPLPLEELVVN